jgi:Kdo2-lipid IVA lauroyltransferase/acyltransferase
VLLRDVYVKAPPFETVAAPPTRAWLRLRHWHLWLPLAGLRLLAFLPLSVLRGLGAAFGELMYWSNAKRRRIARVNLRLCFPDLSETARQRLLKRHYRVAGQSYLDVPFLAWASERRFQKKMQVHGFEHVQASLDRGRRVILIAPHCLGMNVGGLVVGGRVPMFSMIKLQKSAFVNWLLNKVRTRYGVQLVAREQGLRPVLRGLNEQIVFYYLPDEDFGPKQSVFAPFFGMPTATLATLGRLAAHSNADVIPCFTRLLPRGRGYEITLKPALADYPTGERTVDAARMNQVFELGIREMPEQYMWTFKLFKTRPEGTPSPYRERKTSPTSLLAPQYWHSWLGVGVMRALAVLPLPVIAILGHGLGAVLYYLHPPRRRIAQRNIARCFPELTPQRQQALVRAHYRGFGQAALDIGISWWARGERLKRLVRLRGYEHYEHAQRAGRNIILLAPHFLGLEMGGMRLSLERPLVTVFRPPDNHVLARAMWRGRSRFGMLLVEHNKPLTALVRQVKSGKPLYYLPDQDAGRRSGSVFAPFFGIQTATFAVLGRLAGMVDAAVIPCWTRQLPGGAGYEVVFEAPLAEFPTGNAEEDARRMNQAIERAVRECPEQYFWLHKRFKTRPRGEPKFY